MIKRSLLGAALLAVIGATAAGAQSITSPYDFVETNHGFYLFGTAVFTDRGTLDTGPGSGYAAGLAYDLHISGPFSIGVRGAYLPTDRRVYTDTAVVADSLELRADPTFGLEQIATADIALVLLDATLRFDVTGPRTWHNIQPYALIGAGGALVASQATTGEDALPEDTQLAVRFQNGFTGHVGAGVDLHLSDRLTVRGEARDLLWKLHIPDGFAGTGRLIDQEQWVQTAHLSLGLTFRF